MNVSESIDFYAWLFQESESPHWKIMFCDDNNKITYEIPVGVLVYFVLNRVNRIKDDGQIDFSKYADILDANTVHQPYTKDEWLHYYDELLDLIEHKSEMHPAEKARAYRVYSQFAYYLLNNFDFDEWIDFAETCEIPAKITNPNYKLYDVIKWCGNSCDENGTPYISYWIKGFEYLFILDLWELLYNPNANLEIKKCKYCNDFFYSLVKQRKYCCDCREQKQYNKIKNDEQKKDEAKRLCKLICDILYKRNPTGKGYQDFLNENQYHKARLKGEIVKANSNYPDIKTKEEYLQWLIEYHERIKIRKGRKNGKTDEASERDGSDHEGIGQTKETVPSDDNPWME